MSHYYTNDPTLAQHEHILDVTVKDVSVRLTTDSGVFSKTGLDFGTRLLIESVQLPLGIKHVIDMGCGYGPISIILAKKHHDIMFYAYDVNERAVELTEKNSQLNDLSNVKAQVSFLFEHAIKPVDVVITNPPIRAGKHTVFALYEGAKHVLKPHGLLYVVIQKKQGAPSSVTKLTELFGSVDIIERSGGYWILLAKKQEKD